MKLSIHLKDKQVVTISDTDEELESLYKDINEAANRDGSFPMLILNKAIISGDYIAYVRLIKDD